jgi:hypothetical protein
VPDASGAPPVPAGLFASMIHGSAGAKTHTARHCRGSAAA